MRFGSYLYGWAGVVDGIGMTAGRIEADSRLELERGWLDWGWFVGREE